ncbi:peptide ABC transporter ATP-binding protein [Bacillus anthracis]|nr:peptide ABC transporter ATP-binding protein [Bacillus anthracis]
MKTLLEVKDLQVFFFHRHSGEVEAVRGVTFGLKKGETFGIVGESGCGKSVTSKALMGLIPNPPGRIKNGEIVFEGRDLTKLTEKEMQQVRGKDIAMIFQDPMTSLNPVMTVGKQIVEGLLIHQGLSKADACNVALELFDLVGIPKPEARLKQYPHELSGGMRQRVVIAMAFACNPNLFIADEPTTALDVTIQAQILELMKNIQKKMEIAIIFITHDLGVVANIADRVVVMYGGQVVEKGTVEDIFYNPKHPYTWGFFASLPSFDGSDQEELYAIPGTPPDLLKPPKGDAFAPRNPQALKIDFEMDPPLFKVSDTHYAATWLLHEQAPEVRPPAVVEKRILQMKAGEQHD